MITIVVLGMHRSGTSCVTQALHAAGMYLGDELMNEASFDNLEGHWEAWEAVRVNEAILAASGATWKEIPDDLSLATPEGIAERMSGFVRQLNVQPISGFKDPRTLITFPLWQPHLTGTRIVACLRHPYNVAHSLSKRDGNWACDWEQALRLWSAYNTRLLKYVEQADPATVFWFDFDARPEAAEAALHHMMQQLGLKSDLSHFNPFLRHHDALPQIKEPALAELYAALQARAAGRRPQQTKNPVDEQLDLRLRQLCEVQMRSHELMVLRQTATENQLRGLTSALSEFEQRLQAESQQLTVYCDQAQRKSESLEQALLRNSDSNRRFLELWRRERDLLFDNWDRMTRSAQSLAEQIRHQNAAEAVALQARLDRLEQQTMGAVLQRASRKLGLTFVRTQAGRSLRFSRRAAGWLARNRRLPNSAEIQYVLSRFRPAPPAPPLPATTPIGQIELPAKKDAYDCWLENNQWNDRSADAAAELLENLRVRPLLSIVMPVYNVEDRWLRKAVDSILAQVYLNWELCIADDASTLPSVRRLLRELAATDRRIKVHYRSENGNISAASNSAAALASGQFIVLMDQDDELEPDCLLKMAAAIESEPAADIIYSDDDKMDEHGRRYAPQFKPDWSPELLLSYMYLSHVLCVRRELFEQVGGFRSGFDGCQDYDLALRLSERARKVVHVPQVLYHWRALPHSTASSGNAKPEAFERGVRAVQEAVDRRGITATASRPKFAVDSHCGIFQLEFPDDGPSVSILIPTRNRLDLLENCVGSILKRTTYRNYEIVIVDNESDDPRMAKYLSRLPARCRAVKFSRPDGKFNFSQLNNWAAGQVSSDYLLFLNNDTEVREPEWLSQMVGYAGMQGVGAVGARLLYSDGRVQHSGVVLGMHKGLAGHAFKLAAEHDGGYMGFAAVPRNYSAVTAACMLTRRELFLEMGGFDEQRFAVAYNDVEYGLRLQEKGLRCVCVPRAELYHHESATRSRHDDPREPKALRQMWGQRLDPYYNPNLSLDSSNFEVSTRRTNVRVPADQLPVRVLFATHNLNLEGAPLFQYELARRLKDRGLIDPVVHSPNDGPLNAMYRDAGIEVAITNPLPDAGTIEGYSRSTGMFGEWIRQRGCQVVHANTLVAFYALEAAQRHAIPSLWSIHESVDWRSYFQAFGGVLVEPAIRCFQYPYRITFVADATRQMFGELESKGQFTTINCGLDRRKVQEIERTHTRETAKAKVGCPAGSMMVTIVGTTCERKGQHEFVNAAVKLIREGRRDVVFYVVGCRPSPYLDAIKQAAVGFESQFRFVHETDQALLYFRASDVFVCCSRNESFPRVTLEAMAFGLPMVTTTVFGLAEQVADEISALTYQPEDVTTLVSQVRRLLDDPALRERIGEGAKHRLDVLVSFEEMVEEYEKLLLEAYLAGGRTLSLNELYSRLAA